jgi:hypothetical protein
MRTMPETLGRAFATNSGKSCDRDCEPATSQKAAATVTVKPSLTSCLRITADSNWPFGATQVWFGTDRKTYISSEVHPEAAMTAEGDGQALLPLAVRVGGVRLLLLRRRELKGDGRVLW